MKEDRYMHQLKIIIITVHHDECYCGARHTEKSPEEVIDCVDRARQVHSEC